jgi:phage host-nuclease inhibitor protein Gam
VDTKKKPKHKPARPIGTLVLMSENAMLGTLNSYVELRLKVAEAKAAHEKEVAELRSAFDDAVQQDREALTLMEASVQLYCVNHRAELFSNEKKSKDLANATIGFRTNPPSVGKRIAKDTFEAIALRLDELPWGEIYVDWKISVNKEALLRDRAQLSEEQLQEAGIRFEQEEFFFIEPSSEAIERVRARLSEIKQKSSRTADFLEGRAG